MPATRRSKTSAPRSRSAKPPRPPKDGGPRAAKPAQPSKADSIIRIPGDVSTTVHVGDCRDLLKECAPGSVDLIYADPPFNWKREYDRVERVTGEAVRGNRVWDDALDTHDYMSFTLDWLDGCIRALGPRGALWVNIPDDWAAEIVCYLKGLPILGRTVPQRMTMINWCVWHYRFGQNVSGRFINSKVHVLYFVKDAARRVWNEEPILEPSDRATTYADARTFQKKEGKSGLRVPMDVWYGKYWGRVQGNNKERRPGHDNQIPEVYLERVIRACSNEGDLVLDPFLGSGTTCTVARELRRRSIGFEYSLANARSAAQRIARPPLRVRYESPTVHINPIFPGRGAGKGPVEGLDDEG
ncbi:MAG: site-specific DNA-methyltransferase [Planctomycetota bacterium]|nr:site-specific DNA-methyltransferase [Planctomycetota bacterium]